MAGGWVDRGRLVIRGARTPAPPLAQVLLVLAAALGAPSAAPAQLPLQPLPPRFGFEPGTRETLFELELRARVLGPERESWGLYGAYAQRSLWDIDNGDDPFRVETNFRPETGLLIRPELGRRLTSRWPRPLSVAATFVHESNGLEGELSRGWNRAQGSLAWQTRGPGGGGLAVALTAWKGFRVESTNEDLTRYAGDGELVVQLARGPSSDPVAGPGARLRLRSRFSFDAYHGRLFTSFEATALLRPRGLPRSILPGRRGPGLDLLVQWFVGTGEMLQHFRNHENRLRVGLAMGLGVQD